ncbi:hypothetical protein ACWA2C_16880 [Priestia megaterium]|jgi:hypothetical protein
MPKKMLKCKKNVHLTNDASYQAFTKDKLYRPYKYNLEDGYDVRQVLCVKNDKNERHIIQDKEKYPNHEFYNEVFEEVLV